ncbi:hypothetical protein RB614_18885 [Phytohabitans sp. ZYX-F-186]|uniref:NurA domain-containing protein n=1 Tax=Phytohabitans maris TaxID=3071409 RepID=A0ABU0ZHQ4_9ACTN|nr:hypothetical protein [Phytohabitans sp. ZYX-F-186]MDQ7906585.1 hypothetical protein [Phytohabitans sp. ZYX-F-186]
MTRLFVDTWAASYGASFEGGDGPTSPSTAKVETDPEVPAGDWHPIVAPAGVHTPDLVLLVDGVQRVDGTLSTEEDDGTSFPGLAASYAAGVVRCDLARGAAELAGAQVARALFTASPSVGDVTAGQVRYAVHKVDGSGELSKLHASVQGPLTALEVEISGTARTDGDLLVVDGPLRGRRHLPRTIGYIKKQDKQYLPPALTLVVTALIPGQRSPIFKQGTAWGCWSWYLRLPGASGAPWSGIVRVECSPDLSIEQAVELANLSLVTLPRFASTSYKDPRAPQNLIPIAGLERRLRALLGDPRLLHRALTLAAVRL